MTVRNVLALAGVCVLGACVNGPPDALYRFGGSPMAVAGHGPPATVTLGPVTFPPASEGDRLLAVHGDAVRYIKGMRWVSGAPGLFGEGLRASFAARAPQIRVLRDGSADAALDIAVTRFEARYADTAMALAPDVVIEGDATLVPMRDRQTSVTSHFSATVRAAHNGKGAVAAAFDAATALAQAQIIDWVAAAPLPGG